jgi:hypothetical protein
MTEHEYTMAEAAELVGYAVTTLRDRVTQARVPHHRRYRVKGVFFTDEDIAAIKNGSAFAVGESPRQAEPPHPADRVVPRSSLDAFLGLRSLRSG